MNVNKYTKLNNQKRVSMSGNIVDNKLLYSSVTITVFTSILSSSLTSSL